VLQIGLKADLYEACPKSILPFWISREPVAWPWCNLAAGQKRLHCASVNSHSPVRLVSRQWDAVDWACVLCGVAFTVAERTDPRICINAPAHSTALVQAFLAKQHITQVCQHPYSPDLAPCDFWFSLKLKSPLKVIFVNATTTQYTSSVNGVSLPTD